MESIKARIQADGMDSTVEFSIEEAIAHQHLARWGELNDNERERALKDYALLLFARQNGVTAEGAQVRLEGGSFSQVGDRDI